MIDKRLLVITGPSAAGKTTVARLLAQRFKRGVHLEGDFFRRSIVSGRAEITPELGDEAMAQLRLRYRLAAAAAETYFEAGFAVALEDVIAGRMLSELAAVLRSRPLQVVVLIPARDVIAARDALRPETGYARWSVAELYDAFVRETPRIGLWVDSSTHTPEETVEEILRRA